MSLKNELYTRLFVAAAAPALERTLAQGLGVVIDAEHAAEHARAFADVCTEQAIFFGGMGEQVEWEMRQERLQIATQMMAALLPQMLHHTPWEVARRSVTLADALIDVVDE